MKWVTRKWSCNLDGMRPSYGLYCYDETPMIKSNLGKKGFTSLRVPHHNSSLKAVRAERQASENPEARADAETMQKHCLLACSLWLVSLLSSIPQEWRYSQWLCSSHINCSLRKYLTGSYTGEPGGCISLTGMVSSQMTQACIKLT